MNISTSGCSSGGESGWTMYFDQISGSTDQYNNSTSLPLEEYDYRSKGKFVNQEEEEEEAKDEDLSMISDASSGPPQYFQQDEEITEYTRYTTAISGAESQKGKHKKKGKEHRRTESSNFHLDDTASSPAFNFTKNNAALDIKHDKYYHQSAVSATHLKGKSVRGKHLRFFKS